MVSRRSREPQSWDHDINRTLPHGSIEVLAIVWWLRMPFRNVGEQIGGSFVLDGETYLVEAKWVTDPVGDRDLHAFHGKLDGKAQWARGLFVSYNGFTDEGLASFGKGKKAICMEGRDFYDALERGIPLREVLERKVRHAAETGHPFLRVMDLYGRG